MDKYVKNRKKKIILKSQRQFSISCDVMNRHRYISSQQLCALLVALES